MSQLIERFYINGKTTGFKIAYPALIVQLTCVFDSFSRKMKLNDKILEMGTDSTFPALEPRPIKPRGRIILPPLSFAFYVVPGARAHVCMAR